MSTIKAIGKTAQKYIGDDTINNLLTKKKELKEDYNSNRNLMSVVLKSKGRQAGTRPEVPLTSPNCHLCYDPVMPGVGSGLCKSCKKVEYCSKECQLMHWQRGHKDVCNRETTSKKNKKKTREDRMPGFLNEDVKKKNGDENSSGSSLLARAAFAITVDYHINKLLEENMESEKTNKANTDFIDNLLKEENGPVDVEGKEKCGFCFQPITEELGGWCPCQEIPYCSDRCRWAHWERSHKDVCKEAWTHEIVEIVD